MGIECRVVSTPACLAFLLVLSGCGGDDVSDLNKYVQEVKSRPKAPIEPLPEIKVVESFIFKPDGLRDPFRQIERANDDSSVDVSGVSGIHPDTERRKEELEAYPLDTLRMVGTLRNEKGFWGLIRANDGTIHRVQVGNHMGQNYGKILRILDDKIELMEIVPDKPGTWREQESALAMADDKGL
ncbi:pilus assembly protein PilP [Methylomonas sp. EFPC3]|uniref:pilus assembly protein PilP n=1 Tax=Methylomonas TaxID=416 RepID=UPI0011264C45|nr:MULTISPECIES: pilus assembly protein PilP [Methylomonas]TPQ24502.1 pilus assembly protein PilP [Methylomonas koyamae]WFP52370.1 pilus assembly protein PilP [Methylomonas sp. EFPC3]